MEGQRALWSQLLWATVISLASCENITVSTPASFSTQASDAIKSTTVSPANFPQSSTEVASGNDDVLSPAALQTQCSYTVTAIKYGLGFIINDSPNATYKFIWTEDGGPAEKIETNATMVNITKLKPCTEYKHRVEYLASDGKLVKCSYSDAAPESMTGQMSQDDITFDKCSTGCLSFSTGWDVSTSLQNRLEKCDNKSCIKPDTSDICSNLTITFACASQKSLQLTKFISTDFLSGLSNDIRQIVPQQLPANITAELPPKCTNLSVVYSCLEADPQNGNVAKNVSDLEPYTKYFCTGQIRERDVIIANLSTIPVTINCDLKAQSVKNSTTNTSATLTWTTTSENCPDFLSGPNPPSYKCKCWSRMGTHRQCMATQRNETHFDCIVDDLQPYTYYDCRIQPKYRDRDVAQGFFFTDFRTPIGVPEGISRLHPNVTNNFIKVKCDYSQRFNGPNGKFHAILRQGSTVVKTSNESKCVFSFQDLSFSTTYEVEVFVSNQLFNSTSLKETLTTQYNEKALIGFLLFLIIFTSLALLVVLYRIYVVKRQRFRDMSENLLLIPNATPVEPIEANVLLDSYKRKLADEGRLFLDEFQSIPKILTHYTVKEAKKNYNIPKNRYVDILPYDYNRVQLSTGNGEAGCDYINASFIDGYKESKKYIAAQGPKEETVVDFWRMIWEQRSSIIVMVTRCEEGNKNKCVQYWPSIHRETEMFEEFIVKNKSENHFPDYSIRRLSLTNKSENAEREVTHIQFISWPDHGVPEEPHLLLKLRRRVNAFKNVFSGPIVIHCSAGVGRTGTYIGIDAMIECLEAESKVDIYGYVFKLRKQRCLMVQVEAQYILIHQALVEHNQFGETEIALSELHGALSMLKENISDSEPTFLEEEFHRLPNCYNWKTFNTGITEDNKKKNRCSTVIPYDYNRVLLRVDDGLSQDSSHDEEHDETTTDSEEEEENTKYINASNIHGYWGPRGFIATQTPLKNTIADFWDMVYQKKASTIVMLSGADDDEKESAYWEKEKSTYGDIEVEVTSKDACPNFIKRNMLIRHVKRKDSRVVTHVQFLNWLNRELPETPQDLTDMIKEVKNFDKSQRGPPVVVHCSDGSSRCGIFCALWRLLDSAETEKVVDVFHVVRTLRKERQGMIASLAQYQFVYDALDGVYPVQNGEVKAVQPDSVQLVNESITTDQQTEEKAADVASTTEMSQQGAAESESDTVPAHA
ncbi:receptor-type tyrosine-protein phosphatase C [Syngnathus scovelli]|uniref:receptor-type tyrosine-protein phosphatase C n=1 Tax=Syngnathus scovelli TaxID=161590 RepID=UPI002110047E|nr:receptor-type tyrosine-protein phosphatase C [Syngnathus scovelli]XP_049588169.1 receptor-type tyrosine-protein phosphatase C [Syngnathus scovelli]XP_049588171.1 receptor-type tyrosine-protein phosphatase C [Syngnathus scovelli]